MYLMFLCKLRPIKNCEKHSVYAGFYNFCPIITHSSTLLTMPVAFTYLSPFLRLIRPPCVKGGGCPQGRRRDCLCLCLAIPQSAPLTAPFTQGGLSRAYNYFTNYAVSICKLGRIILADLLSKNVILCKKGDDSLFCHRPLF